jgi:hypothetical protein
VNIKFTQRGVPELLAWLQTLARGVKGEATRAVAEYLIGDQTHGLAHYVPYKYVTMKQAYGGFVSDKQRRYVMARIREGSIDPGFPHRTGEMQRGWTYSQHGSNYTIKNETPYAGFVMGDNTQANMHNLIGWRRTAEVVKSNLAGAYRHAQAKIREWLRTHGKRV